MPLSACRAGSSNTGDFMLSSGQSKGLCICFLRGEGAIWGMRELRGQSHSGVEGGKAFRK